MVSGVIVTTPPPNGTLLSITPISGGSNGFVLTPYSARGLTQTLEQITGNSSGQDVAGSLVRRTISGTLVDLTPSWMRKYASVITCKDVDTPCLDDAWIGATVIVDCVIELSYPTGGTPQRGEVSGSSRVEGDFTFYRPQLIMMVTNVKNSRDEYNRDYTWLIGLQEV